MRVLTAEELARQMAAQGTTNTKEAREPQKQTPTFLLELPLVVGSAQAKRLRAHLEVGRQFYNALLSEGQRRLRQMRADPAWQAARAIPPTRKQERAAAFRALRERYGFSEYALQAYGKSARCTWIADHLDAVLAQTLASRAYHALNRVCVGQARRVRNTRRGRGLSSIENKRNDTGLRFVLQEPEEGNQGYLLRTVVSTGGTLIEVSTRSTKLSQWCHGCGICRKKPHAPRFHQCPCGIGPIQRDLYSAFLAAYLDPATPLPSCAQYQRYWEGAEARLRAAHERNLQRAKAGQVLPQSFGVPRAGARLPESLREPTQESVLLLSRGRLEAWKERSEPPVLEPGELSDSPAQLLTNPKRHPTIQLRSISSEQH